MNILAIGDVTGPGGIEHLRRELWRFRRENDVDFCIVNGENAEFITGISPENAEILFRAGADVITGGNHTLRNRRTYTALDETNALLRPLNFDDTVPGSGYTVADVAGYRMLVISAMGNVHIEPNLDSPFTCIDRLLARMQGQYDFAVLDIHAEATGEKTALAFAYDGKIQVIFGTHTHVQTADDRILPRGTGYITDIGMCGESEGILGMEPEGVIYGMRTHLPTKYAPASGKCVADGVIFTLDTSTRRVSATKRVHF